VFSADTWRDSQNGIGRWRVLLEPDAAPGFPTFGVFAVDDNVQIDIDTVTVMEGYVDDVQPYLGPRGVHTELVKLTGRDYGLDLAQFYFTGARGDYRATLSGDIVRGVINSLVAIHGAGNPEITPPAAGIGNAINYEWANRTTMADGFRDICELDDHDFYVQDAVGRNLVYFPIGDPLQHLDGGGGRPDVDLIDFAVSPLGNILKLELGEELGLDLKNYFEAHAGIVDGHWTDLNGTDVVTTGWRSGVPANTTVSNNFVGGVGAPEMLNGKTSILCERDAAPAAQRLYMYLDFAALTTGYNQGGSLDLHDEGHIRYLCMAHDVDVGVPFLGNNISIGLGDNGGNIIYFYRNSSPAAAPNDQKYTADLTNDRWYEVTAQVGEHVRIGGALPSTDYWFFDVGGAPFNWWNVERIYFNTLQASPDPSWFLIDGLRIPGIEASALSQDAGSIGNYGYRMRQILRPDIKSQFELQDFSDDYVAKHRYPLESLRVTTIGQTGARYAGQSLDVVAPAFGIGDPGIGTTVEYRILKLHHSVVKNSNESDVLGFTFLTEFDLVKHEIVAGVQPLDPTRYFTSIDPQDSWTRKTRLNQRFRTNPQNYRY